MILRASIALCLLTAAAPAMAAAPTAPAWTVDKAASKLSFRGAMNGATFDGVFRRWDAQINFDPQALASSRAVVTIDAASAVTGDETRDESLPTADWFSTKAYPKATFVSRQFKDLGGGRYQAIGDLTLRGVSKPIILPFTLVITGAQARMNATITLDRTVFGVGQGQWKSGDTVASKVTVNVALLARRAAAAR